MGVKSGCIVVAALIIISAFSGCIDQKIQRSGISEEENQKLPGEELKNNLSTQVTIVIPAQTTNTNESAVERLKREQAESIPMSTPVPAAEDTPIYTAQNTPASITPSPTPTPVTTPHPLLIQTPTPTPTPVPTTTPVPTPVPVSTPGNILSFKLLSLSYFYN